MSEHHGFVVVQAPIRQVYELFTHFNDFPKFMSFVKEVTYYDDLRSHWVVQLAGTHEWDAVNEEWVPDRQIGWRSIRGLQNEGRVKFLSLGVEQTQIDVYISYTPPAGMLGEAADRLLVDEQFDAILQKDLTHFARMVEEAPAGALDPMQSHYLFHDESAVARQHVTSHQEQSMQQDSMMSQPALDKREEIIAREQHEMQAHTQQQAQELQRQHAEQQEAIQAQQIALQQQARQDQQIQAERQRMARHAGGNKVSRRETLGGRGAQRERTALGDQDARSQRFPNYQMDPMRSRAPGQMDEVTEESPWNISIHGQAEEDDRPRES